VSDLVNPTCYVSTYSDCRRCSRDMFVVTQECISGDGAQSYWYAQSRSCGLHPDCQ
jgi:hypothetical protein